MKTLFAIVALAAPFATSAQAQDWAGFYGGLSYGDHSGEKCYTGTINCPDYLVEGDDISLFGGYNLTNGPWVYGGELAVSVGGVARETIDTDFYLEQFIDLKIRGGYAVGDILYFGSIGYSVADADESGTPESVSGALFSLGADYLVTDNFFIGAEYMERHLKNENFQEEVETFSIRAGYKF